MHVSGLLVQPFFTTAGPDVVREVGPDQIHGLDTHDPKKVFPSRRPTDQHHAISTSATRYLTLLRRQRGSPVCARNGPEQLQQLRELQKLLDHLVGASKQRGWNRDAQRLRGLEIGDEIKFCRLLHG
jgi:hypothetical protein